MIKTNFDVIVDNDKYTLHDREPDTYTVIGIDGGTTNLGLAILFINKRTNKLVSIKTFNLRVRGAIDLTTRIFMMGKTLEDIFMANKPITVGVETPFISLRNVTAVIPLSRMYQRTLDSILETSKFLMRTIRHYDIIPSQAKVRAGGTPRSDKDEMRRLLTENKTLAKLLDTGVEDMTEHQIDSLFIALVALDKYNSLNGEIEAPIKKKRKKRKRE